MMKLFQIMTFSPEKGVPMTLFHIHANSWEDMIRALLRNSYYFPFLTEETDQFPALTNNNLSGFSEEVLEELLQCRNTNGYIIQIRSIRALQCGAAHHNIIYNVPVH